MNELHTRILAQIRTVPVFDVHSHLGGRRQAQNLADLMSYHWLTYELRRAARRGFATKAHVDPESYILEILPYVPHIRQTTTHFAFMSIMRDLYGVEERTLTPDNWRRADEAIRAHADDASWIATVLDRAGIRKVSVARRDGMPDDTPRWMPYEYGEYMLAAARRRGHDEIAGHRPEREYLFDDDEPPPKKPGHLKDRIEARIESLAKEHGVRAIHLWPREDWIYRQPKLGDVQAAVSRQGRGEALSFDEKSDVTSFAADCIAKYAGRNGIVVQFFHGMTAPSPDWPGCASTFNAPYLRALFDLVSAHRDTTFDLFLATRIPSHEAAAMGRTHTNLMVSGAWWHGFAADTMLQFFRDRLDLMPTNAWNAFYSDGYAVEWIYGKLSMVLNRLSLALAQMVDEGLIVEDDCLDIARDLLHDNAACAYLGE